MKVEIKVGDYVMLNKKGWVTSDPHHVYLPIYLEFKNKVLTVVGDAGPFLSIRYTCIHGKGNVEVFADEEIKKIADRP